MQRRALQASRGARPHGSACKSPTLAAAPPRGSFDLASALQIMRRAKVSLGQPRVGHASDRGGALELAARERAAQATKATAQLQSIRAQDVVRFSHLTQHASPRASVDPARIHPHASALHRLRGASRGKSSLCRPGRISAGSNSELSPRQSLSSRQGARPRRSFGWRCRHPSSRRVRGRWCMHRCAGPGLHHPPMAADCIQLRPIRLGTVRPSDESAHGRHGPRLVVSPCTASSR